MCGIWGFVASGDNGPDLNLLAKIARATETRGRDAFGFAWLDDRGRLRCYKKTGRVTDHLGLIRWLKDARMIIGHCRLATHGSAKHNINNHPHPADGGWFVHNGVIANHEDIALGLGVLPVSDCDSEALGMLIESGEGQAWERCASAVDSIPPKSPFAMLGLWPRPGRVIAIRRGNPLHVATTDEGTYLASLSDDMPESVEKVPDRSGLSFTMRDAAVKSLSFRLAGERESVLRG